jgi:predicted DNA-binding antitoxin AbrB/MazE fold protein
MTTVIKAIYERGVFRPSEPVKLRQGTEVEILIRTPAPADEGDPTGWKAAEELIGFITDAPADMAENHDLYLFGRPLP